MIPLSGWHRHVVDGGVLLVAPDPDLGAIRIRTGLPLLPARRVVEQLVAPGLAGAPFVPFAPVKRFTTAEGEHAALFELVAKPPGKEMRRAVAVLVGEHELVIVDGRALRPEAYDIAAKVEAVASGFIFGLGTDRWRKSVYAPPEGWHGVSHFRADVWLAPGYPRNDGVLTVFHARPVEPVVGVAQHTAIFEQLTAEYGAAAPLDKQVIELASGLTGEAVTRAATIDGETRQVTNVGLTHGAWMHLLRLESAPRHAAANIEALKALLLSIEPIPTPKRTVEALNQWSE